MTIVYRTDGAWGTGKGGNLTPAEVDTNFHTHALAIAALGDGPTPAEIADITLTGTQLTITLDDARVFGPYTIPRAAFRFRDDWVAATAYAGNDVVTVPGDGLYLVRIAHTSDASFDPARLISSVPVYQLMYREPRAAVVAVPGATFTPTALQAFAYFRCAAACVVTIPANASAAFPIGTELHFRQGDGAVTFGPDTGVTLNIPTGLDAEIDRIGGVVTCKKVATDEWDVFGLLKATA